MSHHGIELDQRNTPYVATVSHGNSGIAVVTEKNGSDSDESMLTDGIDADVEESQRRVSNPSAYSRSAGSAMLRRRGSPSASRDHMLNTSPISPVAAVSASPSASTFEHLDHMHEYIASRSSMHERDLGELDSVSKFLEFLSSQNMFILKNSLPLITTCFYQLAIYAVMNNTMSSLRHKCVDGSINIQKNGHKIGQSIRLLSISLCLVILLVLAIVIVLVVNFSNFWIPRFVVTLTVSIILLFLTNVIFIFVPIDFTFKLRISVILVGILIGGLTIAVVGVLGGLNSSGQVVVLAIVAPIVALSLRQSSLIIHLLSLWFLTLVIVGTIVDTTVIGDQPPSTSSLGLGTLEAWESNMLFGIWLGITFVMIYGAMILEITENNSNQMIVDNRCNFGSVIARIDSMLTSDTSAMDEESPNHESRRSSVMSDRRTSLLSESSTTSVKYHVNMTDIGINSQPTKSSQIQSLKTNIVSEGSNEFASPSPSRLSVRRRRSTSRDPIIIKVPTGNVSSRTWESELLTSTRQKLFMPDIPLFLAFSSTSVAETSRKKSSLEEISTAVLKNELKCIISHIYDIQSSTLMDLYQRNFVSSEGQETDAFKSILKSSSSSTDAQLYYMVKVLEQDRRLLVQVRQQLIDLDRFVSNTDRRGASLFKAGLKMKLGDGSIAVLDKATEQFLLQSTEIKAESKASHSSDVTSRADSDISKTERTDGTKNYGLSSSLWELSHDTDGSGSGISSDVQRKNFLHKYLDNDRQRNIVHTSSTDMSNVNSPYDTPVDQVLTRNVSLSHKVTSQQSTVFVDDRTFPSAVRLAFFDFDDAVRPAYGIKRSKSVDRVFTALGDAQETIKKYKSENAPSKLYSSFNMNPSTLSRTSFVIEDTLFSYLREHMHKWDFDVFLFASLSGDKPLQTMFKWVLQITGLTDKFNIDRQILNAFSSSVESGYSKHNPYHCSIHGADVLHCCFFFMSRVKKYQQIAFTPLEELVLYFAAICHDFGHPGCNNQFLCATGDILAVRYNDVAVLESYHASESFKLMTDTGVLDLLTTEEMVSFRKMFVTLILATDLGQHVTIVDAFKRCVSEFTENDPSRSSSSTTPSPQRSASDSVCSSEEVINSIDRLLLLKIIIKVADISNPAKSLHLASQWTCRVMHEFYMQGLYERLLGLPISTFFDETKPLDTIKCQIGFISFIVMPMLSSWKEFLNYCDRNYLCSWVSLVPSESYEFWDCATGILSIWKSVSESINADSDLKRELECLKMPELVRFVFNSKYVPVELYSKHSSDYSFVIGIKDESILANSSPNVNENDDLRRSSVIIPDYHSVSVARVLK